ncbi:MAG TPA: phage tail sheath C-terminal domain-containing protein [Armatimonadota bacterium]
MLSYETPGLYYERVDASQPTISPIRMDVAGLVGIATRGPLHTPVPVVSWRQFLAYFGEFTGAGYLAYAVRAFFENGGQRCWVVRVASEAAETAGTDLRSPAPGSQPVWRVAAVSPGVWGNDLDVALWETHRAQTRALPSGDSPTYSTVESISGFQRATHVWLSQPGAATVWKVVSEVDAAQSRLLWVHPKPESRLPYDSPLTGFDVNRPIVVESVEYTLLVRQLGRMLRLYEGLSLVPEHPSYGPAALAPPVFSKDSGGTIPAAPEPVVLDELRPLEALPLTGVAPIAVVPGASLPLEGGADGLALLTVHDFTGEEVSAADSDEVKAAKQRGLQALDEVSEVAALAVPDIHIQPIRVAPKAPLPPCIPDPCLPSPPPAPAKPRPPAVGDLPPRFSEQEVYQVQAAMVAQCERRRDRIALLDPPFAAARDDALGVGAIQAWRGRFDSKYAALYYPWIRVEDPLRSPAGLTRAIPPSGHVAGQYSQSDFLVGVHKAPANAPLDWAQDVTVAVNDPTHGLLNTLGINAIRTFAGRGIRLYGARIVSSDPDWRYVNVRRLLIMVEKAIDLSTQWAVFEPNDHLTRAKLRLALTSFLLSLWERGALMGAAAQEAFFVRCDEGNNPADQRDRGMLLAEVGVAPSKPLEFVILRVGRADNEFEITEGSAGAARR